VILALVALAYAEESIVPVAAGQAVTAKVPSYLLPSSAFDQCLLNARELEASRTALADATTTGKAALDRADAALTTCEARMKADEIEMAKLSAQLGIANDRLKEVRGQRNVAVVVSGALVLGAAAAVALAVDL
jgi:hypothetical protein